MNCPKCNFEIDDKMLACPNCKKVLKLVCPVCKTINQKNICKKCGFTIVTKCHNCGKVAQVATNKCSKCGFSTHKSVAINASNIDEFACITVDFPNIDEIKIALGSTKLFDKFQANLDRMLLEFANSRELTKEIIDGLYVVKFNKDYSFTTSVNNALKGAIELLNSVMEMNFKLDKLKSVVLQCNIAVLKRDINSLPEDYKSGFDIKLIHQTSKEFRLLNCLQVITDSFIYEEAGDEFSLSTLSSTQVKGVLVMFFELNLKKYVKIPKPKEEVDQTQEFLAKLPTLEDYDNVESNDLYNVDAISFDELKFNLLKSDSASTIETVLSKLNESPKNIINIISTKEMAPETQEIVSSIENLKKFSSVFNVTCTEEMAYEPYGFFKELISNICNFSKAPANFHLHSFEMFKSIDPSNYIQNLINSEKIANSAPEKVRFMLFNIFVDIFSSITGSLIYAEDFQNIDESSLEILQLFFEKFGEFNISYVIASDKDFSLHKKSHFLLSNKNYTQIEVKPASIQKIISMSERSKKLYANVIKNHLMESISNNFKGSYLFFKHAVNYLIDEELWGKSEDGSLDQIAEGNIFVPTTLDAVISKRLKKLSKDENAYRTLLMLVCIGPRVDFGAFSLLKIENESAELQKLFEKHYIFKKDNSIFVNNYNLIKRAIFELTSKEAMQLIANTLFEKVFINETPIPIKTVLYEQIGLEKEKLDEWENLSKLCSSLGDFSAYLNCGTKLIEATKNLSVDSEKSQNDYKSEVYENISALMYKFSPDKFQNNIQMIIDSLEKSVDNSQIIEFSNKILQGCVATGNYKYAIKAVHKILSNFSSASINPNDANFNLPFFFITMIKIEVLFSIGQFKDCIESTKEILDVINIENITKLKPEYLTKEEFEDMIFDTVSFAIMSKIILLDDDIQIFIENVKVKMGRIPEYFGLFTLLPEVIKRHKIENSLNLSNDNDRFSNAVNNIINAFNNDNIDYKQFAVSIHHAKINAKAHGLFQIELFCDLLIGYSYFRLDEIKKASAIYDDILETANKNGIKFVTYITWYLISVMKLRQNEIEIAFGVANNAIIKIEKDENASEFLLCLLKMTFAEILAAKGEPEKAQLCINHAQFIKEKYNIDLNINIQINNNEAESLPASEPENETNEVE